MTRKLILLVLVLLLAISACTTESTPTQEPVSPTEEPEIDPSPYPDPTEKIVPTTVEEPTAYPAPEVKLAPLTNDPYPGPEEVEWPLIVVDSFGNRIELSEYPKAIISISPSTTEILFAIGAEDQVVGRDDLSLFPAAALDVESVGSLWEGVPTEPILALEPDLVIAAQIVSKENIQVLRDLGLNVYHQKNPSDFESLYDNLLNVAIMTGHTEETKILVADLENRVNTVLATLEDAKDAPSVFYELDATDPSNPWTTGSGTFIDYIISMAGGLNAANALEGEYAQLSSEELIAVNPEIILLADALYGVTPESVAERPGWDVIIAVQNGAIYPIDPNIMSVPGPRLVDALEETARLIHPELFE